MILRDNNIRAALRARQRGFVLVDPYRFGLSTPQPTFSNVSLLIHGDARPFVDASLNKFPVENSYASVALASSKASFVGVAAGLRVPANAAFDFGVGAWAIVAKLTFGVNGGRIFDSRTDSIGTTNGVVFAVQATTKYPFVTIGGVNYGLGGAGLPGPNLQADDTAHTELSVSYDGAVLRCFVQVAGVCQLSWSHTVALSPTAGANIIIGNTSELSNGITQSVSELMVVKGEAVYTAAYMPAARQNDTGIVLEAGAVVTFANVKLLLHGEGASASTIATDSSSSARASTAVGNAQISTAQFRFGSASMLFDGTGDRFSFANHADFNFGAADYCIEYQARPSANTAGCAISNYQDVANGISSFFSAAAGRIVTNLTGDGIDIRSHDGALPTLTWKHVAQGRVGTRSMLFVEGELVQFITDSSNITSTAAMTVGGSTSISDWNGWLEEVRVIKGQMPYSRSFIAQAAPHPDA